MKEMNTNMICPKCKELNQKSTVQVGVGSSTLLYCPAYYDEDGVYHVHDRNKTTYTYSCSKGHQMTVKASSKCPNCNWGEDEIVTVNEPLPILDLSNVLTLSKGEDGQTLVISSDGTGFISTENKGESNGSST